LFIRVKFLLPAFIIMFCGIVLPHSGSAADYPERSAASPGVYLEPAGSYIKPGERCTLSVMVDDAVDSLSCVMCVISFDSQIVDCYTALEGELYSETSYSTFFNWELTSPDTLQMEDCVLGYRSFILSPGELYAIVFEGLQTGVSPVKIEQTEVYDIDRNELFSTTGAGASISVSITADDEGDRVPRPGSLNIFPNPFNPSATLTFYTPLRSRGGISNEGKLVIYSPAGSIIKTVYNGILREGRNEFSWNGKNETGHPVSSGVYMAVLKTPDDIYKQKMVLVR